MSNRKLHLSKIIITNDKEPIFNGGILIEDSKILQVGKKEDFGNIQKNTEIIDHGESLICPGFINLHTHLLYSNVKKNSGEDGLFSWLGKLVDITEIWTEKDYIDSVNFGINQALSSGTTYIVENTPNLLSAKELANSPLKALIGLEVFGSDEEKADAIFTKELEKIENRKSKIENQFLDFTFSPHAPYDVSAPLWKKLINWAQENKKPLLTHLEESPQETIWWKNKRGEAIDFWGKINKLKPKLKYWKKYKSGIDFLEKNNLLSTNIIATHLCQADKEDLNALREFEIKLVHSSRSNFYLGNDTANLKLWNELGFLWGVGTDSLASNEDLDLLNEIKFIINRQNIIYDYKISAKDAFCAITSNAAKILNKDHEIGCLKKGYFSDFLVYKMKEKSLCTYTDPYKILILNIDNKKNLKEVWINGKKTWTGERLLHKI